MTVWVKVEGDEIYAVAIYNWAGLANAEPPGLPLELGELVAVQYECRDWYYGRSLRRNLAGLFPKSYVTVRPATVQSTPAGDVVASAGGPPLAHEIALTLRDWLQRWKELYLADDRKHFELLEVCMRTLVQKRAEMVGAAGALPADRLRRVARTAVFTIDKGNRALGAALCVRDSAGAPLDPRRLSTWRLNTLHADADARIDRNMEPSAEDEGGGGGGAGGGAPRCYSLLVFVDNFVCKMADDAELLLALHGPTRQLTEPYLVRWARAGLPADIDHVHNMRVLFTDLSLDDIKKEKLYLVCYVVRIGSMEPQNMDNRRSSVSVGSSRSLQPDRLMRRPFGVACADVSRMMAAPDQHSPHTLCVPFYPCEKENTDTLLRKVMANRAGETKPDTRSAQGLWVRLQLLAGDLRQLGERAPAAALVARKMGFPEVVLPGDARNDLYVTLVAGSFSRSGGKSSERNIELSARVIDKDGRTVPAVISTGAGAPLADEYVSLVYYHEDRPRWQEVFKVCLPIDAFKEAHLAFLCRHRSSNEAKDRAEKPFALAYVRLLQRDGTTLPDRTHTLAVYKIEARRWTGSGDTDPVEEAVRACLALPSHRDDLPPGAERGLVRGPLALLARDWLTVSTALCSTKLTQSEEILGVLKWVSRHEEGSLRSALARLLQVPSDELFKFLQDILDALFNILTQLGEESEDVDSGYGGLVLACLMRVIALVGEHKFQHFQPVLHVYIDESFCHPLAYEKLIAVVRAVVLRAEDGELALKKLLQCMKCLEFLVRFVVRSRELRAALGDDEPAAAAFQHQFRELLDALAWLMARGGDAVLTSQGSCLKYLPHAVPHILRVYPDTELALQVVEILNALPPTRLTTQRVLLLLELVRGQLCSRPAPRRLLVPHFARTLHSLLRDHIESYASCGGVEVRPKNRSVEKVARVLGAPRRKLEEHKGQDEMLELCVTTLGELLTVLARDDVGPTGEERGALAAELLPALVRLAGDAERDRPTDDDEPPLLRAAVSVLLDLLRELGPDQYARLTHALIARGGPSALRDLLAEAITLVRALVARPVFRAHWADMLHLQSRVLLDTLKLFSTTLVESFLRPTFERRLWAEWFEAVAEVACAAPLQAERLTAALRNRLLAGYGDLRHYAARLIRDCWFSLGEHKRAFIPSLVGPLLELSLLPDDEVRRLIIPLFFDMMQSEHEYAGHFRELENEIIDKLDALVEGGQGDRAWRAMFVSLVGALCASHAALRESGTALVAAVGRQLDTLLDYTAADGQRAVSHKMHHTTRVLEFYKEISRPHMYIRYVHKLVAMHRACGQWAEAGLALRLHATLLSWSDAPVATRLRPPNDALPAALTHRQLKEALYLDIAEYLHEGKLWELAVEAVKELVCVYEREALGYAPLAELHAQLARLYRAVPAARPHPGYFRVLYHGRGFPDHLRAPQGFVYRGNEFEMLQDFTARLLAEWPDADLLPRLDPPGEDITLSEKQHIQVNAVEPVAHDAERRLSGKPAATQVLAYHKHNNVDTFIFSRPFFKQEESSTPEVDAPVQNEFATRWLERTEIEISDKLPGILRWFPVVRSKTYELSPLEVALETMRDTNRQLRALVLEHRAHPDIPLDPLTRKLNGIVDAAVMGGVDNYERAFFTPAYLARRPEDADRVARLKDLIADQIPLLEFGLEVHRQRAPPQLEPLHARLVHCFQRMRDHVHTNYGRKTCDLAAELSEVRLRRRALADPPASLSTPASHNPRLSDTSQSDSNVKSALSRTFFTPFNQLASRNSTSSGAGHFGTLHASPPKRREKDKRRARKSEVGIAASSQWYTGNPDGPSPGLRELRQELSASRPLRAEAERERRASQPPLDRPPSERNSVGTTDSNQDDEETAPPPLPAKTARADRVSLRLDVNDNERARTPTPSTDDAPHPPRYNYDMVVSPRGSFLYSSLSAQRGVGRTPTPPGSGLRAPTPPPKARHRRDRDHNHNEDQSDA